ncbi:hypothetical protein BHE74_00004914 [Ensete ventricosum]|nr:hypothetical protein BHE74_00004914 [Ensete ventricosum]
MLCYLWRDERPDHLVGRKEREWEVRPTNAETKLRSVAKPEVVSASSPRWGVQRAGLRSQGRWGRFLHRLKKAARTNNISRAIRKRMLSFLIDHRLMQRRVKTCTMSCSWTARSLLRLVAKLGARLRYSGSNSDC